MKAYSRYNRDKFYNDGYPHNRANRYHINLWLKYNENVNEICRLLKLLDERYGNDVKQEISRKVEREEDPEEESESDSSSDEDEDEDDSDFSLQSIYGSVVYPILGIVFFFGNILKYAFTDPPQPKPKAKSKKEPPTDDAVLTVVKALRWFFYED